jgi:cytochrome c
MPTLSVVRDIFGNYHNGGRHWTSRPRDLARRAIRLAEIILASFFVMTPASSHTADEAQALAERGLAHIQDVGREQAFADFNRPDGGFIDGELYVFCSDNTGTQLANGGNPKLVGKNLSSARDANGKGGTNVELHRIAQTKGYGWYEYLWPNPAKGRVERKVVYVIRIDDQIICASGYYKPVPP